METKTNYRKIVNPDFMGAYSLDDGKNGYYTLDAVLKYVKKENVINPQGKKGDCIVGYTDQQKPFIINATGQKVLLQATKSRYVEDWVNIPITFYVQLNVKAFGDTVDALRFKVRQVAPPRDYTAQHDQLRACTTIDELAKTFKSFSKDEQHATVTTKDEMKTKLTVTE